MKKEVAKKWIKALRSHKYRQGRYKLRQEDDRYCCLGVLCEVAISEGVEVKVVQSENITSDWFYDSSLIELPAVVRHWAEMNSSSGMIDEVNSLVRMNDDGKNFKEIAEVIEQNWEKL